MPVVRAKGNEKRRRESARKDGRTMSPRLSERYCEGIVAFLDALFVGYIQTASTDYSILSFIPYSLDSFHSFFPSSSVQNDKNREKRGERRRTASEERETRRFYGARVSSISFRGYLFKKQLYSKKMVSYYLRKESSASLRQSAIGLAL